MSRNLVLVSALALLALAVVLGVGVVLGGCAAGDGGGDLAGIPQPSTTAPIAMVSAVSPGSSVEGGPGGMVPATSDAAVDTPEASPGPTPSYQGPNPPPDPPPSPSAAPPLPPGPTPDASVSAPPMPPAGPVVIVCVVPGASVRFVCQGLPGDDNTGIFYTLANGSETLCENGSPAKEPCPTGAACIVRNGTGSQAGTCQ